MTDICSPLCSQVQAALAKLKCGLCGLHIPGIDVDCTEPELVQTAPGQT